LAWKTKHEPPRGLDWNYFWATSRVIPGTINEFPLWNLLFADLHAHVLAMPLLLFVLACGLNLVRVVADREARWRRVVLAAAALTNAWDAPLLAGLLVLLFAVAALSGGRPRATALARSGAAVAVAAGIGVLLVQPLWVRGAGPPGWGASPVRDAAHGVDVL